MKFADLHIHALAGCDDGAKTEEEMLRMVDTAYESGTRILCLTPHCHPGYFGNNRDKADAAFIHLAEYAREKYPDLELCLGNELRYDKAALSWLRDGTCRTLNDTEYVLVDFSSGESRQGIEKGLHRLLNAGYIPVLAHVERYRALWGKIADLQSFKNKGILFQMDGGAPLGDYGFSVKLWSRKLLKNNLIDLMSSDSHGLTRYPPGLSEAYDFVKKKYGSEQAESLFWKNGAALIRSTDEKG